VAGAFIIDDTSDYPAFGLEIQVGPYVAIDATVWGGVSIGLARAGVQGDLTIVSLELAAKLTPTLAVGFDGDNNCLEFAEAKIVFEGPLTLTGPNGSVSVVAYLGANFCLFGECWNTESEVFSAVIANFKTYEKEWLLWNKEKSWAKKPGNWGMCPNAVGSGTKVWNSPTNCGGNYCQNGAWPNTYYWHYPHDPADPNLNHVYPNYKVNHTYNGCIKISVVGQTEWWYDRVGIYNASGDVINNEYYGAGPWWWWGWSGWINSWQIDCSGDTTVTLENDYSIQRSGITVTFSPW
jgi:hypothetical protein